MQCNRTDQDKVLRCSGCKAVVYCDENCQKQHWDKHRILCSAIQQLEMIENKKVEAQCDVKKAREVNLVGERPIVECQIANTTTAALWDTGSQVSMISRKWMKENAITEELMSLSSIIGRNVSVEGVGGAPIPYDGVVNLQVRHKSFASEVPFLVTRQPITEPILGFNVIAAMMAVDSSDAMGLPKEKF